MESIGIWLANNDIVAMKFTPASLHLNAEHEYRIYTWLGAINNTEVEKFGIPSVYWYGWWNNHVLMAMTLLDSEFHTRCKKNQVTDVDILIVFREFVNTSTFTITTFHLK